MNDDIHVSCKLNNKSNCLFGDVFFEVFKEKNSNKFVHYWKFVTNRDVESWNPLHQKCKLWITYPRLLSLFIFLWNIFFTDSVEKNFDILSKICIKSDNIKYFHIVDLSFLRAYVVSVIILTCMLVVFLPRCIIHHCIVTLKLHDLNFQISFNLL